MKPPPLKKKPAKIAIILHLFSLTNEKGKKSKLADGAVWYIKRNVLTWGFQKCTAFLNRSNGSGIMAKKTKPKNFADFLFSS